MTRHFPHGRRLLASMVALALASVSAVVGLTTAPARAAAGPSTLTMATDQISTFNPFISYFDSELGVIGSIYPSLDIVQTDGSAKPYLADSWTTSADKLTWTFKLHQGLKWSDGQPITAKDAAWTFTTIMTNKVAGTANGSLVANFATVKASDDSTLVITTKKPQANMLFISVPFSGIQILPQHLWQSKVSGNLKSFLNTPTNGAVVGYGPWKLTGYKTDQYTTMDANKDYFLGAPKFDRIVLQYFKNQDAQVQALQSGQIEVPAESGVSSTQFKAIQGKPGITAYQLTATHWAGIEINPGAKDVDGKPLKTNTASPILADRRVRLAIAYGIDRDTLVKKVLLGLGTPGQSYLPPAYKQWAWSPSAGDKVTYNTAKANQILDQAGYAKGSDGLRTDPKTHKPLSFRLGTHSDDVNDSAIANYLAGWMKDIGIKLTVQSMSFSALNANLSKGDWDILMDGWSMPSDPSYLLSIQTCAVLPKADGSGGNTDAYFCDPQYDKLYAQQQTQFDQAQRAQTIGKMQEIVYQANCDIMLYNDNILRPVRTDKVQGFMTGSPDSTGTMPLQNDFYNWQHAAPAGTSSSTGGGVSTGAIVGIVVAVVVVVAVVGFVVLRRRTTATERE